MKLKRALAAVGVVGALLSGAAAVPAQAAAPAPMGDWCLTTGECGTVRTHATLSRGRTKAVHNWVHNQSAVTAKSIAASQGIAWISIGGTSKQYWQDTDGVIARPECNTTAWISYRSGAVITKTLTPGWAYKVQDNEVWTIANNGPNCVG